MGDSCPSVGKEGSSACKSSNLSVILHSTPLSSMLVWLCWQPRRACTLVMNHALKSWFVAMKCMHHLNHVDLDILLHLPCTRDLHCVCGWMLVGPALACQSPFGTQVQLHAWWGFAASCLRRSHVQHYSGVGVQTSVCVRMSTEF